MKRSDILDTEKPHSAVTSLPPASGGRGSDTLLMSVSLVELEQMEAEMTFPFAVQQTEGPIAHFVRLRDEYLKHWQEHQGLFTQSQAAAMLGVTRQTVHSLLERGVLDRIEMEHAVYVGGRSLAIRLQGTKGKTGRPRLRDSFDSGKSWD
jgi:predicted XRE-type DNA-binding protein